MVAGGIGVGKSISLPDDSKIKLGDGNDLQIYHTSNTNSVIRDFGTELFIDAATLHVRRNVNTGDPSIAKFNGAGSVQLWYDQENHNLPKFETLGVGATVNGDMYATNFYGNGGTLDGIDATALKDSNDNIIAQAVSTGLNITGTLSATTTADATPAIIATNTGGLNSTIQRWVGESDGLEVRQAASAGDYQIVNTAFTNGIKFADGAGGVILLYNGDLRLQVQDTEILVGNPSQPDVDLLVTGDITAFSSSDIRLKDNISPITKALEKVKSISGNTYTKKSDGSAHTGVIAQEIEALGLPGITTTRSSGYMAVDYEKIVPLLIEAIKELSAKVDTLESMAHPKPTGKTQKRNEDRLDALENQINN